jgi:hypothetical protein
VEKKSLMEDLALSHQGQYQEKGEERKEQEKEQEKERGEHARPPAAFPV